MPDRRRYRRVAFKLRALVDVGPTTAPHEGHLMDLSEGGAFFLASAPVTAGQHVSLRFQLGGADDCEAVGRVLRTMPSGELVGIAIEFSVCGESLRHFVRNLASCPEPAQHELLGDISQIVLALR